jgi:hypothetical protein
MIGSKYQRENLYCILYGDDFLPEVREHTQLFDISCCRRVFFTRRLFVHSPLVKNTNGKQERNKR